jgi:hypothetical protein
MMAELTTSMLRQACRLFMELAYPGGVETIPPKKRVYYDIPADRPLKELLPPAADATGIAQEMCNRKDGVHGYEFRLGSAHFMHLKLRVQMVEHRGAPVCVFTVNTHDAFSRTSVQPPPEHPDAPRWLALQEANRQLKDLIEDKLEHAGFLTFKGLLRGDLDTPPPR